MAAVGDTPIYDYGSKAGPTSKFQAFIGLKITGISNTQYRLSYNHAIKTDTTSSNWATVQYTGKLNGSTVWSGSASLGKTGWYADNGWIDLGWKDQGTTISLSMTANYTGGSGTKYESTISKSYTVPTLYWTVSYNANGGSGAPANQTKYRDQTLTLSSTVPTRSGYSFAGWGTSATATGVSYSAGGSYTSNAAITLYAIWTVNKTCTIEYDANGGTGAPISQSHVYDSVSNLSGEKPTRDGYQFLGWSTASGATNATWLAGRTYINNDFEDGDTITLYAVWVKVANIYFMVPDDVDTIENILFRTS